MANEESKSFLYMPSDSKSIEGNIQVSGYDFNEGLDYHKVLGSYLTTGFQATNFGKAVEEINKMVKKSLRSANFHLANKLKQLDSRDIPLTADQQDIDEGDSFLRTKTNCTIFLGYTSNIVSSGLRETIRFLVQHKLVVKGADFLFYVQVKLSLQVDCIVSTAGGVEEDFIKCMAEAYVGSFELSGVQLREKGINRIGNLLVPNENYCLFEKWMNPILDEMLSEQKAKNIVWSPSKVIHRLGKRINDERSIYYWAAKNEIPVFCPALTDGSLGDIMFFHSCKSPGLIVDILSDLKRLNSMVQKAINTGMIIVGGGLIKHHICNANLMVCL